jgi:site-specific recombinase XerD
MASRDRLTLDGVLAGFDEHLRRTRGVCAGTRRNYARFVRVFLQRVFADGPVDVAKIHPRDVVEFVGNLTGCYRPRTVELAASSLRSFFRFLRAEGLRDDRLEDAVPMVPHRPTGLVRHLDPERFEQLIASLDSSSPRGLRDQAIILCMARLALRASEVVQLRLEDVDWAQRHRAGACPQDRSRRAAAVAWRGGSGAGRLPTARAPGHSRPAGVRAALATGRRADQQQHRRPRGGQRVAACGHRGTDARS